MHYIKSPCIVQTAEGWAGLTHPREQDETPWQICHCYRVCVLALKRFLVRGCSAATPTHYLAVDHRFCVATFFCTIGLWEGVALIYRTFFRLKRPRDDCGRMHKPANYSRPSRIKLFSSATADWRQNRQNISVIEWGLCSKGFLSDCPVN